MNAGLLAKEYGHLPHEVLHAEGLSRMEQFNLNMETMAATNQWVDDHREDVESGSSGTATSGQKRELQSAQEQRAARRESMEKAGKDGPSAEGQLSALHDLAAEAEQNDRRSDDRNERPDDDRGPSGHGNANGNIGPRR